MWLPPNHPQPKVMSHHQQPSLLPQRDVNNSKRSPTMPSHHWYRAISCPTSYHTYYTQIHPKVASTKPSIYTVNVQQNIDKISIENWSQIIFPTEDILKGANTSRVLPSTWPNWISRPLLEHWWLNLGWVPLPLYTVAVRRVVQCTSYFPIGSSRNLRVHLVIICILN